MIFQHIHHILSQVATITPSIPFHVDTGFAAMMAFISVALSVIFQYLPKLKDWYSKRADNEQKLIMFGAILVTEMVVFGLGCLRITDVVCNQDTAFNLAIGLITGIVSNQGVFGLLPNPNDK